MESRADRILNKYVNVMIIELKLLLPCMLLLMKLLPHKSSFQQEIDTTHSLFLHNDERHKNTEKHKSKHNFITESDEW